MFHNSRMNTIHRQHLNEQVQAALKRSPIVALLGPRQCGKTTLAQEIQRKHTPSHWFDLENPRDNTRLENPLIKLESLSGLIVLDEIQLRPDSIPILRVLADRKKRGTSFLILGSASPELLQRSSESLAGRIEFVRMSGFSLFELKSQKFSSLWLKGGFPKSYLSRNLEQSFIWRENFIQTFLERDIRQLGIQIPAMQLRRFWQMAAHLHGNVWNGSEIAGSLGISHPTSRHYLDLLTGAYMIRQLSPWVENLGKRLVKTPKIYIRDSGILHALLGLKNQQDIEGHPKYGLSWEGFCIEQILSLSGEQQAYFWGTHGGAELDLLIIKNGKKWGFEFKTNDAPTSTLSMRSALKDLKLEHLWIVYPGTESYALDKKIDCIQVGDLPNLSFLKK